MFDARGKTESPRPRASAPRKPECDVVIVGAGAAGLSAARALRADGRTFVVLEAKARAGGRAVCAGVDRAFPLGAEFLHGEAPATRELLDAYGATHYDFEPDFHVWEDGRLRRSPRYWEVLARAFARIRETTRDRSFSEFLRGAHLTADQHRFASAFVEGFNAAESERISSNALKRASEQVNDPEARRFARPLGGYGPFFDAWARDFRREIRFGRVVRGIARDPGGVSVRAETGGRSRVYRARGALVTVPIGVLRADPAGTGGIAFAPPIPGFARTLARIEMGEVVRITLDFAPAPFRRWTGEFPDGFPFVSSPDLAFMTWWSERPLRWPTVTAWAGGQHAIRLRALPREERIARALDDLGRILGARPAALRRGLRSAHHHDWTRDPYARGAYSYPGVGSDEALARLARPIDGALCFAGEALDPDQSGTVEGAIANGRAQARKLVRALERRGR